MNKPLSSFIACLLLVINSFAQENNPLINSGEIIDQGVKLYDDGKYKESIAILQKVNRSDTNYVRSLYELSLSYTADSQYNKAIQICEMALAEKSDLERLPEILTQYGSLIDNIGNSERALHIFDSALQIYPAYTLLYLNKGTTLLRLKKYKEAEAVFKQCVLIDPYSASSHYKLGVAALEMGRLVPAMLSFINYLVISPDGRYSSNCITLLSSIAKDKDDIKEYVDNRTEEPADEFKLAEQIIRSKIALDKNYKPIIELDDAISRQIQVLLEKLDYTEDSNDFWMQYYVPLYKNIFKTGQFEYFINHIFSGVNLPQIKSFNKNKKKEIQKTIDEIVVYFNRIRSSRELVYGKRETAGKYYYYAEGRFSGAGKAENNGEKFVGEWNFYYPGGNIKSKGLFNNSGARDGKWTYYYPNGDIKGVQSFSNGKQQGTETFYFSNGGLSSKAEYESDNPVLEAINYFYAGSPSVVAKYGSNGKLNGERRRYYSNGSPMSIENYTNDKLDGAFKTFYKNGIQESEGRYLNEELDANYKSWYENGQLASEGSYIKGKADGIWKKYHENGKLKSTETYSNGKSEGPYEEYYDNGQLFTRYVSKKGNVNGEVSYFDDDGKLFSVLVFADNVIRSARYLDKSGKQVSLSEYKNKKLDLNSYYTDATHRAHKVFDEKGNVEGIETDYYHSGTISQTSEHQGGALNGITTSYFPNGQKSSVLTYKDDKKDGYYKSYYQHGTLESEGWYQDNLAQGTWIYYDELGKISASSYFRNDELDGYKEEFYANGKIQYETKYHLGWMEEMIQYDTLGKEISRVKMNKGSGKFTGVHQDGKLHFEGNYVQGDFDGPYHFYFFDGSKQVDQYYKKGLLDSVYTSWYFGGTVNTRGQYQLGKKTGVWKYFLNNGKLHMTEEYKDGKLSGHRIYYFENGKIDTDVSYRDGSRNGYTSRYDPSGNLMYRINFNDDLQVGYSYLDKAGNFIPEISLMSGNGKLKSFYSNGKTAATFEYKDGKVDGPNKLYYFNGALWAERTDSYDITDGPLREYFENGQLKSEYNYLHDNLHGPYKIYTEKAVLREEGIYYNGNIHGDVKLYDDNGKLKEKQTYYYGTLLTVKK